MESCGYTVWFIKEKWVYTRHMHIDPAYPPYLAYIQLSSQYSSTRRRGSQGDLPTLIRFSGGLNAASPILTSWTACGACGPSSCRCPSSPSCGRGSPVHTSPLWVVSSLRLRCQLQVAGVSCHIYCHFTLASRVYLRIPAYTCAYLHLLAYHRVVPRVHFIFIAFSFSLFVRKFSGLIS